MINGWAVAETAVGKRLLRQPVFFSFLESHAYLFKTVEREAMLRFQGKNIINGER